MLYLLVILWRLELGIRNALKPHYLDKPHLETFSCDMNHALPFSSVYLSQQNMIS